MADQSREEELEEERDDLQMQLESLQADFDELENECDNVRSDYRSEHQKAEALAKCLNNMRDIVAVGEAVDAVLKAHGY